MNIVERAEAIMGAELERLIDEAVQGTEVVVLKDGGADVEASDRERQEDAWF